jgi:hypothetical protein
MRYNNGEVQVCAGRVVLKYHDPRGRPREALLAYCIEEDVVWIKPRLQIKIGTLEIRDDEMVITIPISS